MPAVVDFPQIVHQALERFGPVFANACQRRHFAEYLTGLLIAQRKNVTAINQEFVATTDPSCLHKFLTDAPWDGKKLNWERVEWLQEDPATCFQDDGVIPVDNVLIGHTGELIEDVAWFWDHCEQRYKIAHDYIFCNYVCPNGKHYPLDFRRFQTEQRCKDLQEPFRNHTVLTKELIDEVCSRNIPGTFTFDSYFTNAETLNYIHSKELRPGRPRAYVGDLKMNRKVEWQGHQWKVNAMAAAIGAKQKRIVVVNGRCQWYFTCTLHLPKIKHKVRIVFLWKQEEDDEPRKVLITNQLHWEVHRIVGNYRHRWTGTEPFHRDGKQHLGMGDCQLRDSQGQTRHMDLVMVAHSLLVHQLDHRRSMEWASERLMTIGQACRALVKDSLRQMVMTAITFVQAEGWSIAMVLAYLKLGMVPASTAR